MSNSDARSDGRPTHIWLRPTAVWIVLVLLGLASLGLAYVPLNAFNTPVKLAIAGIMIILLWSFLMDLIGSTTLLRLIAVAGVVWLSFMFALTFSDYLSRACVVQVSEGPPVLQGDQKVDRGALDGKASPPQLRRCSPG